MKALIQARHPEIRNAYLKQITIYKHASDTLLVDNIAIFAGTIDSFPEGQLCKKKLRKRAYIFLKLTISDDIIQRNFEVKSTCSLNLS